MGEQEANTKRVAKNTLLLYFRMLFGMLVSLYTSRVVLEALGEVDYGVYNVVGGFVAMFSLISSSLSSSTSRFLTFELGKGEKGNLGRIFSTSLTIHAILGLIVLILTETVGIWFLNAKMNIPADRMYAANWVFQASIVTFILGVFSTPFNATIISHERMGIYAFVGVGEVVLKLFAVLFVAFSHSPFDRLIVYALLLAGIQVILQLFYWFFCKRNFDECRIRFSFDRSYWKEMSSFAGWNFIGCTAGLLKDQGVNILINLFFGPTLNAARGISTTVNGIGTSFAGNFMTALNPQITKSYASGDKNYSFYLVEKGSRFSFYILMVITIPIILETDFLLTLWLKNFPEHTVNFVRLVLGLSLVDILSNTLITLQAATGKIRNYQLAVGGMLLLNFPLSYLFLKMGMAPEVTYMVAIGVAVCCLVLRLLFLERMAGLPKVQYFKRVCLNVIAVMAASVIIPFLLRHSLNEGWMRFLAVGFTSVICSAVSILFVGCSVYERKFLLEKVFTTLRNYIHK